MMSPGLQTPASSGEIGHTSASRKLAYIPFQYCCLHCLYVMQLPQSTCFPHTLLFHALARLFLAIKLGIAVSAGYMTETHLLFQSTALHGHLQTPFLQGKLHLCALENACTVTQCLHGIIAAVCISQYNMDSTLTAWSSDVESMSMCKANAKSSFAGRSCCSCTKPTLPRTHLAS